jgi:TnpA family transposase
MAKVRARDELVTMLCKRMGSITKKAKEDLEKIRERHRAESERLIAVLGEVLEAAKGAVGFDGESVTIPTSARRQNAVHAECGKAVLERLEKAGGLAKLSEDHELVSAHHGDNYAPLMRRHFRSHRKVLLDLTETLSMVATSTDDTVLQAVEFCQAMRHRGSQWVPVTYTVTEEDGTEKTKTVSAGFAPQMWQRILFDKHKPAGPAQVARHMRQKVSVHELSLAGNQHITAEKLNAASADVIDMFIQLDLAHVWGDVGKAGIDGSQYDTWENNMLAESHIRYGGFGGISMRHVSDTYIALFSHFIPCGVWEAVYLFEGLLKNQSEVTVDIVHGDTQGQSLPVFGLAHMLGVELLPRIRNWKDLTFYRPSATVKYQHIEPLFNDPEKGVINWRLIENHWQDLMRVVLSIREGRLSSAALLRRLGNESKRNRIYQAYRELGRVMRTITLLRFLSEPELRESIQAMTNKVEAFHKFSNWLMFASDVLQDNDPDHQEKTIKFNELLANCLIFHTAVDIMKVANDLIDEGWEVDPVDLATVPPYITSKTRRFGTWHLDMEPPENEAVGRLRTAA